MCMKVVDSKTVLLICIRVPRFWTKSQVCSRKPSCVPSYLHVSGFWNWKWKLVKFGRIGKLHTQSLYSGFILQCTCISFVVYDDVSLLTDAAPMQGVGLDTCVSTFYALLRHACVRVFEIKHMYNAHARACVIAWHHNNIMLISISPGPFRISVASSEDSH